MPEKSIKLAALLKDVADRPETPATSLVSLNILLDADPPRQNRTWRKNLPKMGVMIAAAIILGLLVQLISEFRPAAPARQTGELRVPTKELSKPQPTELTPSGLDPAAFSKPVQELMKYVQCLRKGQCAFDPGVTGEEVAKQFGYSRLFASAYEEMALQAKAREGKKERTRFGDLLSGFELIVREEQAVDQMLTRKERHAAAIAYLRALQNGDVLFPGPQALAPAPPVLLAQLVTAYPDIDLDDPLFAAVYRQTREFAAERLQRDGEVFAHQIIGELRRLIVKSATSQPINAPPTMCEKAEALAELTALTKTCPRLRLSRTAAKLAEEVAQQPAGVVDCQNKAATSLRLRLEGASASERAEICERAARRIQLGQTEFLELAD